MLSHAERVFGNMVRKSKGLGNIFFELMKFDMKEESFPLVPE